VVLRTLSQARAWRPAVVARLARTLGVRARLFGRSSRVVVSSRSMNREPLRHASPNVGLQSPLGGRQPTLVWNTPLANRFTGFATINAELVEAREMLLRQDAEADWIVRSALWRAAAAMYARCFAEAGRGMPRLEERDHLANVPENLLAVHRFLIEARHNFLSHAGRSHVESSSTQVVLLDPRLGKGVASVMASRSVRSIAPPSEVAEFCELLTAVIANVQESMRTAHARVQAEINSTDIDALYASATYFADA